MITGSQKGERQSGPEIHAPPLVAIESRYIGGNLPATSLTLKSIGIFRRAVFDFDLHVNVFVGPNNTGKSTALIALGEALVFPFGIPRKLLHGTASELSVALVRGKTLSTISGKLPLDAHKLAAALSRVGYTCFIPALRWNTDYRSEGPHADRKRRDTVEHRLAIEASVGESFVVRPDELVDERSRSKLPKELLRRQELLKTSPTLVNDRDIVQTIVELDYRAYRLKRPGIREVVDKIATIASEITEGFPLKFGGVGEDSRGLFVTFATLDGSMPLNVLSQGTQSLVQWISRFVIGYSRYYVAKENNWNLPAILIIDEIDAHLHPSWQRRVIPTLMKHFGNLQIFCSTHSPLMLSGLAVGQIHLLRRNVDNVVESSRNQEDVVGWTVDEIMSNFLGIRHPTDIETSDALDELDALERRKEPPTPAIQATINALRLKVNDRLGDEKVQQQTEEFAKTLANILRPKARKPARSRVKRK